MSMKRQMSRQLAGSVLTEALQDVCQLASRYEKEEEIEREERI